LPLPHAASAVDNSAAAAVPYRMRSTVTPRRLFRHALVALPRRVDARSINRVSFLAAARRRDYDPRSMYGRLAALALVLVGASFGAGVAASTRRAVPAATCTLGSTVLLCSENTPCSPYGAVCDTQAGQCVCALTDLGSDLGTDLGAVDLGSSDLAGADLGGGNGGTGVPSVGGGMTSAPRSGCSFIPGQR
jgi:hypothetical protein